MSNRTRIAVELVIMVAVSLASSLYIENPVNDIAIGLAFLVAIEVMTLGSRVDRIARSTEALSSFVSGLKGPGEEQLDHMYDGYLLHELTRHSLRSNDGSVRLPTDAGIQLLLSLFPNAEHTLLATNYSDLDQSWNQWYGERAMIEQEYLVKRKVEIKRVFIVDNEQEAARTKQLARRQDESGVQVRVTTRSNIEQTTLTSRARNDLGTLDFVILDGRILCKVFLDRNRKWKYVEMSRQSEDCTAAKKAFNDIWEQSIPWDSDQLI